MGYLGEKRLNAKTIMVKLAIEQLVEGRVVRVGWARLRLEIALELNHNII